MPQSRENVHILRMLEGLLQQVRPTSHSGSLSRGPVGLLHPRTESGADPLHHNGAGCNRQGRIRGGWTEAQGGRSQATGGGGRGGAVPGGGGGTCTAPLATRITGGGLLAPSAGGAHAW
eukprot:12341890-Ditylum_brightwellii.AAC.1